MFSHSLIRDSRIVALGLIIKLRKTHYPVFVFTSCNEENRVHIHKQKNVLLYMYNKTHFVNPNALTFSSFIRLLPLVQYKYIVPSFIIILPRFCVAAPKLSQVISS